MRKINKLFGLKPTKWYFNINFSIVKYNNFICIMIAIMRKLLHYKEEIIKDQYILRLMLQDLYISLILFMYTIWSNHFLYNIRFQTEYWKNFLYMFFLNIATIKQGWVLGGVHSSPIPQYKNFLIPNTTTLWNLMLKSPIRTAKCWMTDLKFPLCCMHEKGRNV